MAGGYLREQISRRERHFWLLMLAYGTALLAALGAALSKQYPLALVLAVATACFGVAANDSVTALLPWRRGHDAETAVAAILEELRRDGYLVVNDVMFGGLGNLDHVVVGANGAFLVETKLRRYERVHLGRVKRQAQLVHDEVGTWVTPVICAGTRDKVYDHRGVMICGRGTVVDAIRSRPARGHVDIERVRRFFDRYAT